MQSHDPPRISPEAGHSRARTSYFDAIAEQWDAITGPDAEARISEWCARLKLRSSAWVVDVGCGTGISSVACADQLGEQGRVIAVDRSQNMLREAHARRPHPRILWTCADAQELPLGARSVDVILALHVWPHLDDHELTLMRWRQMLRRGGNLLIVHLVSRDVVNSRHRNAGEAVVEDVLPPAALVASMVTDAGLHIKDVEDDDHHYLIRAVKP